MDKPTKKLSFSKDDLPLSATKSGSPVVKAIRKNSQSLYQSPDMKKTASQIPNLLRSKESGASGSAATKKTTSPFLKSQQSNVSRITDMSSQLSDYSTMSTRNQIGECKDLIFKALNYKKQGNTREYYGCFRQQAILKGTADSRSIRVWVKAFLECLPQIVTDYRDYELVDMFIFKLPWLCHGQQRTQGFNCNVSQSNQSSNAHLQSNASSFSGALKRSQITPPPSGSVQDGQAAQQFPFGPSLVHGELFNLFVRICFDVFPLQVQYVHRVIKHLFSHLGLFSCEQSVCIGHWKVRNHPELSPPTVADLINARFKHFYQQTEQVDVEMDSDDGVQGEFSPVEGTKVLKAAKPAPVPTQGESMMISKVTQGNQQKNSTKTLEEISQKAKMILKSFNLNPNSNRRDSEVGLTEVTDSQTVAFLRALFSFHPTKKDSLKDDMLVQVGLSHGQPTFFVDHDAISVKKCLIGLQDAYIQKCQDYADAYCNQTQVKQMCSMLVKIVRMYPFAAQEIYKLLLKSFPHQASSFEHLLIYQKLVFGVSEQLLRQAAKQSVSQSKSSNDSDAPSTATSLSELFNKKKQKHMKNVGPLKQALQFEQQILSLCIEKIATLDADVKIRGRKGATFPSGNRRDHGNGYGQNKKKQGAWIQGIEDFQKELSLRLLSDKEIKVNLLIRDLFSYLSTRLNKFDKMQGTCSYDDHFVTPLMTLFEQRIFKQAKSNFVQYIPLFLIAHAQDRLPNQISSIAKKACTLFTEKIISFLILKAFNPKPAQTSKTTPSEHLTTRMHALNYLGSLMAQSVAPLSFTIFFKTLDLMLKQNKDNKAQLRVNLQTNFSSGSSKNSQQYEQLLVNHKIFTHSFIQNLAVMVASRHQLIKQENPTMYQQINKILFQKKFNSLEYSSPWILEFLIQSFGTDGDTPKHGEGKQVTHTVGRLQKLMDNQHKELQTTKIQTYNRVARWMPFTTLLYFSSLKATFDSLQPKPVSGEAPLTLEQHDSLVKDEEMVELPNPEEEKKQEPKSRKRRSSTLSSSGNILNAPVAVSEINSVVNPISRKQSTSESHASEKVVHSDPIDQQSLLEKLSEVEKQFKRPALCTFSNTGMVSQAFRKHDKYTHDTLTRVNPQFSSLAGSQTSPLNALRKSSYEKPAMSAPVVAFGENDFGSVSGQSDQMTIGSPADQRPEQFKTPKDLKQARRRDIKHGAFNMTQNLMEQNKRNDMIEKQRVKDSYKFQKPVLKKNKPLK